MAEITEPCIVKEEGIAQPKRGPGGRVSGQNNRWSISARKRLEELGFDPIQKMIEQYGEIEQAIHVCKFNNDGTPREKVSSLALSNLMNTKQKIANDLMRYGYARTPESNELKTTPVGPVNIILTKPGDSLQGTGEDYSDIPPALLDEANGEG